MTSKKCTFCRAWIYKIYTFCRLSQQFKMITGDGKMNLIWSKFHLEKLIIEWQWSWKDQITFGYNFDWCFNKRIIFFFDICFCVGIFEFYFQKEFSFLFPLTNLINIWYPFHFLHTFSYVFFSRIQTKRNNYPKMNSPPLKKIPYVGAFY